jgi:hypothetical protein
MSSNRRQTPTKFPAGLRSRSDQEHRNQYGTPGGPFSEHTAHLQTSAAQDLISELITEPIIPVVEEEIPDKGFLYSKLKFLKTICLGTINNHLLNVLLVSNRELNVLPDMSRNLLSSLPCPEMLLNGYIPFFNESLKIPEEIVEIATGDSHMARTLQLFIAHFVREYNEGLHKNVIPVCQNM